MPYTIEDINPVLSKFLFPTVMMWNRVEGRPRAVKNFDRAIKAEVRDPLWMLTKQWQMGEFEGDDAGSPVLAKVCMDTTKFTKYQATTHPAQPFPTNLPLEAMVEQKMIPMAVFQQEISLDLRLVTGRRWKRMLKAAGLFNQFWNFTLDHFEIAQPDPTKKESATICAHPDTWQQFAAVSGRVADGIGLITYLAKGNKLIDLPGGSVLPEEPEVLIKSFLEWYEQLFLQPVKPENDAWLSSRLEYQFQCSAPVVDDEKVYTAREYYHGHLDWYNFNIDPASAPLETENTVTPEEVMAKKALTLLPTPVMFDGMPNTRWWAFEDGKVNYSYIKPGTQELAKLMFMEFGLVYANDWYLIPFDLPVGTIAQVKGMSVSNVFGENFWIEASGRGSDQDWDRWSMFSVNIEGRDDIPSDTSLLLLPSVPKIQQGEPVEQVALIRDEMANMVWGIESKVYLAQGVAVSGSGAAAQYQAYLQKLVSDALSILPLLSGPVTESEAKIRYEIMNQIPEHWIPFIPVHVKDDIREIQLQRAAMPRILKGETDKPDKVRPRTSLLKEGLEQKEPYYIFEEEVPRNGVVVQQAFQRTRWKDGKVIVWFGSQKTTGRGEGSSGLAFDRILANK